MNLFKSIILVVTFVTLPAIAKVKILQPGDATTVGNTTVVCEGESLPEKAWMCSCFKVSGDNVGWVEVFASDKQDAMEKGDNKCHSMYNDWTLHTIYHGCTELFQ